MNLFGLKRIVRRKPNLFADSSITVARQGAPGALEPLPQPKRTKKSIRVVFPAFVVQRHI
jgi:hypothetical protein